MNQTSLEQSRNFAEPQQASADMSLRSADASQCSVDRECVENKDSKTVNIFLACQKTFVEGTTERVLLVFPLNNLCAKIDILFAANVFDSRIALKVH